MSEYDCEKEEWTRQEEQKQIDVDEYWRQKEEVITNPTYFSFNNNVCTGKSECD
jgi:hypothetical protein